MFVAVANVQWFGMGKRHTRQPRDQKTGRFITTGRAQVDTFLATWRPFEHRFTLVSPDPLNMLEVWKPPNVIDLETL